MTTEHLEKNQPSSTPASRDAGGTFSVKNFAPGWGASVMGTGALSLAFFALSKVGVLPAVFTPVAHVAFWVALLMGFAVLGINLVRWIRYTKAAWDDLAHPVKGGMTATIPGAFLVLAVVMGRVGVLEFGEPTARTIVFILTAIGGLLALVLGVIHLSGLFASDGVALPVITGSWFIPPVVLIIIPTALAPFIGVHTLSHQWDIELLTLSWLTLGIGTTLFLVVTTVLFVRTATAPMPPAALAPTLVIGSGPSGLIGLDLLLLAEAAERTGWDGIVRVASVAGLAFWGFGAWWLLMGLLVITRGYTNLPFALSWWAFIFPLGAWTVAGVQLGAAAGSVLVLGTSVLAAVLLLIMWAVVFIRTANAILRGTIWE